MRHAWNLSALALLLSFMTVVFVGCGDDGKKTPPAGSSATAAGEAPKLPDWVPVFPDVKPQLIENKKTDKETSVTWYFPTSKTPAEVKAFYKKGFEASGFKDLKEQTVDDKEDGVQQENVKGDDGKRSWFISARLEKNQKETQVSLVYITK